MKKISKIVLAVVALFAYSCALDTTEDLGINVGGADQTTITLSLEESRTQLGEKAGDLYPLQWSEGDKISINGVESNALSASEAGQSAATFSLAGSLTKPYCIAYPAAAAGQVVFADKQTHVSNTTFGSGVSTMYAYSEEDLGGVSLNHLTGVLKIGVVGSAKIVLAQISNANRMAIAGAFDFDFEKGEATPTSASKEVIEYSFGEGVQLSSEPTYIHAVVPAGVYDELYVTLYDEEGGVMYATVKTDETKPLTAGKVREFASNIVYAATDNVFVVKDVASLKAFAEQAATLDKDVLFVADVDMTGETWTPIEGYAKTVRGNGYAIKGLTAPLFGYTSASFKGLHLVDVNIEATNELHTAALALDITATEDVLPTVKNCSVSGNIKVDNSGFTISGDDTRITIVGLVGQAFGVEFDSCHNGANITLSQAVGDAQSSDCTVFAGGIVGRIDIFTKADATVVYSNIYNSTNTGNISTNNPSKASKYPTTYVGGVLGASAGNNKSVHVEGCWNRGKISANGEISALYLAGVAAYSSSADVTAYFEDNNNYGVIELGANANVHSNLNIGGVSGRTNSTAMFNCNNYGAINLLAGSVANGTIDVGGVAAYNIYASTKTVYRIENCTNNAPINAGISRPEKVANTLRIGGIVGYAQAALYYDKNYGKITVSGNLNTNGARATADNDYKSGSYVIGGLVGYKTEGRIQGGENHGDIEVSATVTELHASTISQLRVAGLVGYLSTDINDSGVVVSDGDITISGTFGCEVMVGGNIGLTYSSQTTDRSEVDIVISGKLNGGLHAGGVIGLCYKNTNVVEFDGSITVTEDATIGTSCYIGGCVARVQSHDASAFSSKVYRNRGDILFAGTSTASDTIISGCIGSSVVDDGAKTHASSDMKNLGNITVTGNTKKLFLNGIGYRTTGSGTDLVNGSPDDPTKGVITFSGNTTGGTRLYVSGLIYDPDNDLTSCINYGAINISGSTSSTMHVGGISAANINAGKTWTDCCNYGKMTISGYVGDPAITGSDKGSDTFVGGLFDIITASTSVRTMIRCGNYGDIEFTETFKSANAFRCSGFYPRQENAGPVVLEDCFNAGKFTMNGVGSARTSGNFKVAGGIADMAQASITIKGSFKNTGDIVIGGKNATASIYAGGMGHLGGSGSLLADTEAKLINTGKIIVTGSAKADLRIGGIFSILGEGATLSENIKLINTGDVEVSADYGASSTAYIGGISGSANIIFANAESFCKIQAFQVKDNELIKYTGVGHAIGSARSATVIAKNCKIGGTLVGDYDIEEDEYIIEKLSASNFHNHIYGSGKSTDWSGTDNYDGCSYISVAPTIE